MIWYVAKKSRQGLEAYELNPVQKENILMSLSAIIESRLRTKNFLGQILSDWIKRLISFQLHSSDETSFAVDLWKSSCQTHKSSATFTWKVLAEFDCASKIDSKWNKNSDGFTLRLSTSQEIARFRILLTFHFLSTALLLLNSRLISCSQHRFSRFDGNRLILRKATLRRVYISLTCSNCVALSDADTRNHCLLPNNINNCNRWSHPIQALLIRCRRRMCTRERETLFSTTISKH